MNQINLDQVLSQLKDAKRILLCTHVQPDGDAIGSLLALNALLLGLNKKTTMICHDPVPVHLRLLPGWQDIRLPEEIGDTAYDLGCSIDASDLARIGDAGPLFLQCPRTLVIDHHATNTMFGHGNYVDDQVAASGVLVYRLFERAVVPISPQAALNLYAAISTDTGNFSFGLMNEEFFIQMAGLMRSGLDISKAARGLHLIKEASFIKLLGRALNSIQFSCSGRLSLMVISEADFLETGASREHADGIVNCGLNVKGVEMGFLATQEEDGVKFSLRAVPPHDVSAIAFEFGGGGHVLAAGCQIKLPMDEALRKVRERMEQALHC